MGSLHLISWNYITTSIFVQDIVLLFSRKLLIVALVCSAVQSLYKQLLQKYSFMWKGTRSTSAKIIILRIQCNHWEQTLYVLSDSTVKWNSLRWFIFLFSSCLKPKDIYLNFNHAKQGTSSWPFSLTELRWNHTNPFHLRP